MLYYRKIAFSSLFLVLPALSPLHADVPAFTRQMDIIYHKQDGYALTMEKVSPKKEGANGAAIILVMSGGWFSNHDSTKPHDVAELPNALGHRPPSSWNMATLCSTWSMGLSPNLPFERSTIRSQRFRNIRQHATEYTVDPQRIGIMGGSAGGHLR